MMDNISLDGIFSFFNNDDVSQNKTDFNKVNPLNIDILLSSLLSAVCRFAANAITFK